MKMTKSPGKEIYNKIKGERDENRNEIIQRLNLEVYSDGFQLKKIDCNEANSQPENIIKPPFLDVQQVCQLLKSFTMSIEIVPVHS
jgi:hypothetical protein